MRRRTLAVSVAVTVAAVAALSEAVAQKREHDRAAFACVEGQQEGHLEVQFLTDAGGLIGVREINWTPYGANGPEAGLLRKVMKRDDAIAQAAEIARAVVHPTRRLTDRAGLAGVEAVVVNATCDGAARSITLPFELGPEHPLDCSRSDDTLLCVRHWFHDAFDGAGIEFDSVVAAVRPPCPGHDCVDTETVR